MLFQSILKIQDKDTFKKYLACIFIFFKIKIFKLVSCTTLVRAKDIHT